VDSRKRRLICIEGFDRTGKDTLLRRAGVDWCKDVILYEQPQVEDTGFDYRDSKGFSGYLKKHFSRVVSDLDDLLSKPRCVMMTRFLVSDNTYSEMFGREHILENMVNEANLLSDGVEFKTFLLLWKNYDEYLKRVKASNSMIEYTEEEFKKIQKLMLKEARKLKGKVMRITHETSKDDIFLALGEYLDKKVIIKKSRRWSK
jgi:thymidylate kinase